MTCTTKDLILADLDPTRPETIQALIDFHRRSYGGFVMEADGDDDGKGSEDGGKDGEQDDAGDDEALGEGGKKALQRERDARKDLERQIAELKSSQPDLKKLAEALGLKTDDGKSSGGDVLAGLQKQVADMQRDNLILRVAAKHKITDEGDLELLKGIGDESAMDKVAARLAAAANTGDSAEGDGKDKGRKGLRPDRSQGRGSEGGASRPSSVQQVMEDRRAQRAASKK